MPTACEVLGRVQIAAYIRLELVFSSCRVHHAAYNVCKITKPKTLKEALESDCAKEWKEAADSKYKSLIENET